MRHDSILYKVISATGQQLIKAIEAVMSISSREKGSVPDPSSYPWVADIERHTDVIIRELRQVMQDYSAIPNFDDLSPEQKRIIAGEQKWKTYMLYMYGQPIHSNLTRCPDTDRLLQTIPGMTSAFYSILEPHTSITPHRGPYKGVLRYHLGLIVPADATSCGIRIGDDTYHWATGRSLIFDDTIVHEAWNHSDETRVVLFVDFQRSFPFPVSLFNKLMIGLIRRSPFIADIVTAIERGK